MNPLHAILDAAEQMAAEEAGGCMPGMGRGMHSGGGGGGGGLHHGHSGYGHSHIEHGRGARMQLPADLVANDPRGSYDPCDPSYDQHVDPLYEPHAARGRSGSMGLPPGGPMRRARVLDQASLSGAVHV